MLEERTLAIVLRNRPHGESDKIVTFLTKDWGKVTGIAKGAKRSQRRFVNVLEPFTHVQLRFRPGRTEELAFIYGCDLVRSFRGPSKDLQRFALANYLCELVDAMITGREADLIATARRIPLMRREDLRWSLMERPDAVAAAELALWHADQEPSLERAVERIVRGAMAPVAAPLVAGLLGVRDGDAAVPAAWVARLADPDRRRQVAKRLVSRLAA